MKKRIVAFITALFFLLPALNGCTEKKSHVTLGNVVILGDSYSTFEGKIPEGYKTWYKKFSDYTDVDSYKKTWWHKLITRTNSNLLLNSSYSGTTICHTGYDGADCSEISFVARMEALVESGYFEKNKVDTLIILGGLNDYWAGSPRGEIKYEGLTKDDLYKVYPAFGKILSLARQASPETRIIFISEEYLPEDMKADMNEICAHFGVEVVKLHDISKKEGHPDAAGMEAIAAQVIESLEAKK